MKSADPDFDEVLGQWLIHLDEVDRTSAAELVAQYPQFATELHAHLNAAGRLRDRILSLKFDIPSEVTPAFSKFPRIWGEYRLERMLGSGSMGEIYLAYHEKLNRRVALKVMRSDVLQRRSGPARFAAEARVAANLRHPNIARIYDVGEQQGLLYYTMDFVDGLNLKQFVANTRVSEFEAKDAAKLMAAVADAVEHAHQQNLVHRDLKPSNILIDAATHTPIVTDFGLVKNLIESQDLTQTGEFIGTPAYVAPDQIRNPDGYDAKSGDIYGIGATLYHLLAGRAPYDGRTATQTLRQVLETSPRPPSEFDDRLPKDIEIICLKAMSREPADRYASAKHLADDLRRFARDEPIVARPLSRLTHSARWIRRNPAIATMCAALVAFFLASPVVAVITNGMRVAAVESRQEMELHKTRQENATKQFLNAFRSPDPRRDGKSVTVYEVLLNAKETLNDEVQNDPLLRAQIMQTFGETFLNLDLHKDADALLRESHTYFADAYGDTPETWNARRLLGLAEVATGRPTQPLADLQSIYAKYQSKFGETHVDTYAAKNALIKAVFASGDLARSRELLESLWDSQKANLGLNDLETIRTQQNLGRCLALLGESEHAVKMLQSALDSYQKQLGARNYRTLRTQQNLAAAIRRSDPRKSLTLSREVVQINRDELGEDHHETLRARAFCAERLIDLEDAAAGIAELETVVKTAATKHGETHNSSLSFLHRLGNAYLANQQMDKALVTLQKAFDLSEEHLGPNHPHTLAAMHMLGMRYTENEKFEQGVQLLEGSIQRGATVLGADHPNVLGGKLNLANQYRRVKKTAQAIKLLTEVIAIASEKLGKDDGIVKAATLDLTAAQEELKAVHIESEDPQFDVFPEFQ